MMGNSDDKKAKRAPLRSSIACLRCRKSKIKCDNQGPTGPCDTCLKAGKDCQYPDATPLPPKRQEPPTTIKSEHPGPKRVKKVEEPARPDGNDATQFAEEVLSANYLSATIWSQVFDLYKQHFATELPFLHLPTLKEKNDNKFRAKPSETSPETNLVLLGILTLTARFHPDLVKYVANSHSRTPVPGSARSRPVQVNADASAASDYFAKALVTALGPLSLCVTVASLERVQAFLMLGLYEWTHAKPKAGGFGAWMYVGLAIRMAQALRLGFGDKEESTRRARGASQNSRTQVLSSRMVADKEIRRRTMFSCLILDRMLACGKDRVSTICSEDLQIQLPCSEHMFDFSENVETSFLKSENRQLRRGPAQGDSVLGCFIRLVDIWGEISKFSFAGGRLSEKDGVAPWHETSRFRQLRQDLSDFYTDLPEVFQLSTGNYHRHENHQASSVYVSLHMLGSLCSIMLHREYIPFIAIRCRGPIGPLDEPTFPESHYKVPDGFWQESAEQVFQAAKDIVELIELCGDKLPMSSLVVFAVWTAAFVGIYAHHFPHMDQKGHMLSTEGGDAGEVEVDIKTTGPTGLAYQTLNRMSSWLNLAATFVKYFKDMDQRYYQVKKDFAQFVGKNQFLAGHTGEGKLSLRLGGGGGGLEEWKVHGLKVVNNGSIFADGERQEGFEDQSERGSSVEGIESHNTATNPARTPKSMVSGSFTAINSGSNKSAVQAEKQEVQGQLVQSAMAAPPLEHRSDSLPADPNWRASDGYQSISYHQSYQQQLPQQQHHHHYQQQSPMQQQPEPAYVLVAGPTNSPHMADGERRIELDQNADSFGTFFNAWEHGPWHIAAPGGIESLANNDVATPQILLDSMDFPIMQQVGSFE